MHKIQIHDANTNKILVRDMTDDEVIEFDKFQTEAKKNKAQVEADAKLVEQKKQAICNRLGLTADELKLLLG